jgi:DNA mismatch endonuclease (patch repair protein)
VLRRELSRHKMRYRLHCSTLPGRPDLVFKQLRVALFCDGDFWHGRDPEARLAKLAKGNNPQYWIAKLRRNIERDCENTRAFETMGWTVLRFWETDVLDRTSEVVDQVVAVLTDRKRLTEQAAPHAVPPSSSSSTFPESEA